jgi:YidC/Oxa1 family membrane protein insertase
VKFDTRGAAATSWIIKRNQDGNGEGKPLYSIASTKEKSLPLQLIPHAIRSAYRPLRMIAGRGDLDDALAKNYRVVGVEGEGNSSLEIKPGEKKAIEFVKSDAALGLEISKKITFDAERYLVTVETKVLQNGQPVPNVKMVVGPNIGDQGIADYTFYSVAPEGVADIGEKVLRVRADEVAGDKEHPSVRLIEGQTEWAGVSDTYFAMALVPSRPAPGLEFRTEKFPYPDEANKKEDRNAITALIPVPSDGAPSYLYTGPKDHEQLQRTGRELSQSVTGRTIDLENLIDYGWTRPVTRPLAAPILWAIKNLNSLTGSYGVAIILFTIVIYTLFFPLKWRSSKSMKKAQKLAPRMKELQEKIKGLKQNDPRLKELQMEQLRLMKEGNPLGGCLPLLIQMPFLIALYIAITISIDFRQSSFLWIPDLSAADPIKLLPILMAASMLVLQLITPAPSADPLQRKMMAVVMPLMMLYILWSAPAGLLVYWLVGNLVGFGQQMLINRLLKSTDDEEPQPPEKGKATTKKKLTEASAT